MSIKTWLITGSSQGFGRELVKQLLEKGENVIATTRSEAALQEFRIFGDRLMIKELDLKNRESCFSLVEEVLSRFGQIDVLINNAGYGQGGAIEEVSEDAWREQFEINVFGTLNITQAVLPRMRERKSGYIQVLSSIAGLKSTPGIGFYNGTKFALEGLFEAMAQELAPLNIGVTIIEPGPFRTNFAGNSFRAAQNQLKDYDSTAGSFREYIKNANGNQAGDPIKAAKIMIELEESKKKPVRLLLGKTAVKTYIGKLQLEMNRVEEFKTLSESADF